MWCTDTYAGKIVTHGEKKVITGQEMIDQYTRRRLPGQGGKPLGQGRVSSRKGDVIQTLAQRPLVNAPAEQHTCAKAWRW